jgi:hypothetical protein
MTELQWALLQAYGVGLLIGAFGAVLFLAPYVSFRK